MPACGSDTFWGFSANYGVGKATATFIGSGEAILKFGNCHSEGLAFIMLDDTQMESAGPRETRTVRFSYTPGTVLRVEERGFGIFKINSLSVCNGKCI